MVCPYCSSETQVINSRAQKRSNQVWRRRQCKKCRAAFTTHESIFLPTTFSVARGRKSEPFIPEKLFADILLAIADRKDCYEAAGELTATITLKLQKNALKPLFEPQTISLEAARVLKRFDKRAWLRFVAEHPSLQSSK